MLETNQDYDNNATRNPYPFETLLRAKPIIATVAERQVQETSLTATGRNL